MRAKPDVGCNFWILWYRALGYEYLAGTAPEALEEKDQDVRDITHDVVCVGNELHLGSGQGGCCKDTANKSSYSRYLCVCTRPIYPWYDG